MDRDPADDPEPWFATTPVLRTERLVLRGPRMTDADDVLAIRSDAEVRAGYGVEPYTTVEEAEAWLRTVLDGYARHASLLWMILPAGSDQVVGNCTLWNLDLESGCGELGYELHRDAWGKGFASEAAREVVRFGFETMGLHRIEANPFRQNTASHKLLERMGFTLEGTLRARVRFHEAYLDQLWYGLLRKEWEAGSE